MTDAIPFPTQRDDALADLDQAHRDLANRHEALPHLLQRVVTQWSVDSCVEALASIRPAWFGADAPPLFPAPRGYLSDDQRKRLAGTRAAFEHVDARLALIAQGQDQVPVHPETPYVLNALAEGPRLREEPANPGMIRPGESAWNVRRTHPYGHPPPTRCRDLLAATVATVQQSDLHPVVTGAWLAFSVMSIHPFIDGNGRTARLLHLLASGPGLPQHLDLGVAEQWVFHRHRYQRALATGQTPSEQFDPSILDAQPFTDATVTWSTAGARLLADRADALERAWHALELSDAGRAAALVAAVRGYVLPDDLPRDIGPYDDRLAVLEGLSRTGIAHRVGLPPSRRPPVPPPRPSYRLSDRVAASLRMAAVGNAVGNAVGKE